MRDDDRTYRTDHLKPDSAVFVRIKQGPGRESGTCFKETFLIGRSKECDLQIVDPRVSRIHLKILYEGRRWWIRDLGSANGTFIKGERIDNVPLDKEIEIELGKGGPILSLGLEREEICKPGEGKKSEGFDSVTHIVQHYFDKAKLGKIGEQTILFRRAFERLHKKKSRRYQVILGLSLFLLLGAGGVILYQQNKIHKLRTTAINIFYAMKSLELQIAQLEEIVLMKADAIQVKELLAKRDQLNKMEKEYDHFVQELGIYKKLPEEERIIFKIARLFGECDANVPDSFVKEVWKYIRKWKSSDRLRRGIERSVSENYLSTIVDAMAEHHLPPHFFYVALQESGFNPQAVGPKTRYGHAKGIWQFIPMTAKQYGLQIGPLHKEGVYDPEDERFHFEKATEAASRYIKDLHNTLAQASGLLVMASYNWSETRVKDSLARMPESPKDRNFWRLLDTAKIPQETYDYVFYIVSAAVIGENPHLFGFDFEGPGFAKKGV
jgi:membrane-bound lytic murein transglycosylase D